MEIWDPDFSLCTGIISDQEPPLGWTFIFLIDLYWALGSRNCSVIILVDSIKWLDKGKVTFVVFAALCRTLMSLKTRGGCWPVHCQLKGSDVLLSSYSFLSWSEKTNFCVLRKGFRCVSQAGTHCVIHDGLRLTEILLAQPPKCWGLQAWAIILAWNSFLKREKLEVS